MKPFLGACYKGYVGRMVNPDMWTATRMQHHHQPLWRAAIMAHCRWRGRRVAMRITVRPDVGQLIRTMTDSWVYLVGEGQDIADDNDALGRMTLEKRVELTEEMLLSFAAAETTHDVRVAIAAAYGSQDEEDWMALHLPKPRSKSVPQKTTGLVRMKVTVAAAGIAKARKSSRGLAGLTAKVPVKHMRQEIGDEGLRQAAIDAGAKPRSDRTLRRWAQQDRIPHASIAELAQRRAAIVRLRGVNEVARKIGRSPSSMRKHMSGTTDELRNNAKSKLEAAKAQVTMRQAGVLKADGTPKIATIRVTGRVHVRNGDEAGYDFRTRTLDFGNSDVPFSAEESQALAAALANDDQARRGNPRTPCHAGLSGEQGLRRLR